MKTLHKGFIAPLLLALIALLLIGGGAYVYVHNKQANQSAIVSQTAQATSTAQTSDLKTYTNTKYGFSFQYPPYFGTPKEFTGTSSKPNTPDSVDFLDGRLTVAAGVSTNLSTGQPMTFAWFSQMYDKKEYNKKQITVDGKNAIQVSTSQIGTNTLIPLSNDVIVLIIGSPELQNQILSTFKFNP